jgi:Flp pilus assembly protein TadD
MWRAHQAMGMVLDRLARREEAGEAYRRAREARQS